MGEKEKHKCVHVNKQGWRRINIHTVLTICAKREAETDCKDKGGWSEAGAWNEVSLVLSRLCGASNRICFPFLKKLRSNIHTWTEFFTHLQCSRSSSVGVEESVFGGQAMPVSVVLKVCSRPLASRLGHLWETHIIRLHPRATEWELAAGPSPPCFHQPSRTFWGSWSLSATAPSSGWMWVLSEASMRLKWQVQRPADVRMRHSRDQSSWWGGGS